MMFGNKLKHRSKTYVIRLFAYVTLFFALSLLYSWIGQERFQAFAELVNRKMSFLPQLISLNLLTESYTNFLFTCLVPVNIWFCYVVMQDTCEVFTWDYKTDSLYYFCNQLVGRKKYFLMNLGTVGINFLIMYSIYYIGVLAGALLMSAQTVWGEFHAYMFRVFFVFIMLCCVAVLLSVFIRRNQKITGVGLFIGGTLFLGNFHRLMTFVIWIVRKWGRSGVIFIKLRRFTKALYWISPVSWLDYYYRYTVGQNGIMLGICVLVSVASCLGAYYLFLRKELI